MNTSPPPPADAIIATGMDAHVELIRGQVRIRRSGLIGLLVTVFSPGDGLGEMTIPVRSISSVEIVRSFIFGIFCFEYLRFSYGGAPRERDSVWHVAIMENIVVMGMFDNRDFYALKDAIEREMDGIRAGVLPTDLGVSPLSTPPPAQSTPAQPMVRSWAERMGGGLGRASRRFSRISCGGWRRAIIISSVGVLVVGIVLLSRGDAQRLVSAVDPLFGMTGRREVAWVGGDGLLYRASLPSRSFEAFLASGRGWGEGLGRRLETRFSEDLATELEPVFADMDARIHEYGEWVFDWWTSYILMVRGLSAIWTNVADGSDPSFQELAEKVMADAITERYAEIVLSPDRFQPALNKAVGRAAAPVMEELRQACVEWHGRFTALILTSGTAVEAGTEGGGWRPEDRWYERLTVDAFCSSSGEPVSAVVKELQIGSVSAFGVTGAIDDVAIRITRPFVTTIVSAGLSASSIAAVATGIGIPAALIATPAMAAVITKSAFTLVDLMLSQLDEALNRAGFEAAVYDAVAVAREQFVLTARRDIGEAVAREITRLTTQPGTSPRLPAPAGPT